MADAIIQQGMFTSNGHAATINLYSGVDWLKIINLTNSAANQTTAVPVAWYWQNGMPAAAGISYWKSNAANAANLQQYNLTNGFTLVDTSLAIPGNPVAVMSTTNANPFVVDTGTTTGLVVGSVVRLSSVAGQPNVNGFDFSVGAVSAGVSFTAAATFANAPGGAGGAGFYRIIPYNPLYYPSRRTIANITQAANAVVTTTVAHTYKVGQQVTFRVNADFGMTQINYLVGNITAVTTYTFTTDINSTAFSAFVWANFPAADTYPQVLPVGEDTALALANNVYEFGDAIVNQAYRGISFPGGSAAATAGPAGINNDVIMWVAGVSYLVDNGTPPQLIIQP